MLQLQGHEPDGQLLVPRITAFPTHGTLFNVYPNGTLAEPVSELSTFASEHLVAQWVQRVVGQPEEWGSTAEFLQFVNATLEDVYAGAVPQVGDCASNIMERYYWYTERYYWSHCQSQ